MVDVFGTSTQEAARLSGLDRSVVREWAKSPTKGKVACGLVRGGAMTFDQYRSLNDGRNKFYNNMLLAFLNITHCFVVEDVMLQLNISKKTVGTLADGSCSDITKKALFYVCEKKLGIPDSEDLYNGTFDCQECK